MQNLNRIEGASDVERFAVRLASSRPALCLERSVGAAGRVHVTPEEGLHAGVPMLLRDDLAPVEKLLARLLEAWGDAYGACLFFELWGSARRHYGDDVSRLRGFALAGPKGAEAEALVATVAAQVWRDVDALPLMGEQRLGVESPAAENLSPSRDAA